MKPPAAHKRFRKPPAAEQRGQRTERHADRRTTEDRIAAPGGANERHSSERPSSERLSSEHLSSERLYGVAPVLEALRAGHRSIEQIVIAEGAHLHRLRELMELARQANVPVRRAARAEFGRALGAGANHQGVIATVAAARYTDADELLSALAARVGTTEPPLAVVLDGVEDPRNLGAILRTAECAGAHAVFIPERRAVGLTETVAKASAGALEHVSIARVSNLTRLIDELKRRGIWTVGTSGEAEMQYTDWDYTQPCAIVCGGEGAGLHRLVREHCDVLVRIPLRGHTESLNVSVAAGIVLYEALRQRGAAQGDGQGK
jgi:23S rRNA (guanosine2251-2'-O)-methyltransferase